MKLWLPGAERIPTDHVGGLMLGGPGICTHHITVSSKGSYNFIRGYLVSKGYEPTLLLDPTTGQMGQYLPADRSAFALEHPTGMPETNRQGKVNVQIEWVWPSMSEDITKAPHFDAIWAVLIPWLEQLGVASVWTFGFGSTSRDALTWKKGGHRGHVNAPANTHVDSLPAVKPPPWRIRKPLTAKRRRQIVARIHHLRRILRRHR